MKTIGVFLATGLLALSRLGHDLHRHDHRRQRRGVAAAGDHGRQRQRGGGHHRSSTSSGSGVQTIAPASALPTITDGVTIDGYSQPGASANTNAPDQGTNAVILIEIDGTNTGTGSEAAVLFFAPGQRQQRRPGPRDQPRQVGGDPRLRRRRHDDRRQLHRDGPDGHGPARKYGLRDPGQQRGVEHHDRRHDSCRAQPDLRQWNARRQLRLGRQRRHGTPGPGQPHRHGCLGRQCPRGKPDRHPRLLQHERHDRRHHGRGPQRHLGQRRLRRPAQQRVEPRCQRKLHRHGRHRDGTARQRQLRNPRRRQRQHDRRLGSRERATSSPPTPSTGSRSAAASPASSSRATSSGPTPPTRSRSAIRTAASPSSAATRRSAARRPAKATSSPTAASAASSCSAPSRATPSAATRSTPTAPSASISAATA